MNEFYIRNVLEAALLAAGKPLQLAELGQLFDESSRPKTEDIRAAIDALASEYANRGVEVKETAAGFRIQVRREFSAEISRLWPERPARYSRALLETLALIAYRQPITRAEIEAVRGVAVNPNIIKTVIERNWVRVVGHRDVPGRPELLGTTREFLDYFGLRSLDELPPLAEIKAMGDYNLQLDLPNAAALAAEVSAEGAANDVGGEDVAVTVALAESSDSAMRAELESNGADQEFAREGNAEFDEPVAELARDVGFEAAQGGDALVLEAGADAGVASNEMIPDDNTPVHGASDELVRDDGAETVSATDELVPDESVAAGVGELETDAAAERTLNAGETVKHATVEPDESEAPRSPVSGEFVDSADDSTEDDADDDELSADGHGSRELVAGPRDLND
jgi:segregation and condensation protein B